MGGRLFVLYAMALTAAMGAVIGYSASTGNALLVPLAFIAGIALLRLGRRRVTEVLEDERIYRISEKASRRTLEIMGMGMALVGVSMIALDKYTEVGYALAFSACVLTLLYLIFYGYYSRKPLE